MVDNSLIEEAEQLYEKGNYEEAVARLTSALKSGGGDQDNGRIEALLNKIGSRVFESGSRDIGGAGERGIGTQMASSFFSASGSSHAQLGKLAMLGTILAGNQKSSGSGLQTAISLFSGHHKNASSGDGGWTSLASSFFSHGQGSTSGFGNHGQKADQDTSTFSKLSSLANSYMSNQNGHGAGQHGGGHAQAGYGEPSGYNGSQSKLGAVASMASNFLSDHGGNSGRTGMSNHNESGHNDGLSNLASMTSNFLGYDNGGHRPPTAYGDPNISHNGFNFTVGNHLGPM